MALFGEQNAAKRPAEAPAWDPQLLPLFAADSPAETEKILVALMAQATAIIAGLVRRKFHHSTDADAVETANEARALVIAKLQSLCLRRDAIGSDAPPPVADFQAYVAAVAFRAWAEILRRRYPARAMLLNRLRYLLENRTSQRGFALWRGESGERICGFAAWREAGRTAAPTPRAQWLVTDPRAAAKEIFAAGGEPSGSHSALPELVAAIFAWVGGPLEVGELLVALADLLGVSDEHQSLDAEARTAEGAVPSSLVDPAPTPFDALRWKEYLAWLWAAVAGLSLRQRTAYLLHSDLLRELELAGLASVRRVASLLELSVERAAEIWNQLPLDDRAIGALLGVERQQIINLRKVARATLGRAWQNWLHEKR